MALLPYFTPTVLEAGCDEAGRGCLAGPVVAAAVILPPDYSHPLLNDSKKLSHKQRDVLRITIEQEALAWAVAFVDNDEIDKINILNASFLAMHRAIDQLQQLPQHLIIDGNRFKKYGQTPHTCVIKGDGKYLSIAAASILAKTHRDEWMQRAHNEYPHFNWQKNKGYPTKDHRNAIRLHGVTYLHRKSFRLLDEQMSLF